MLKNSIAFLLMILIACCSFLRVEKQVIEEDFLEPITEIRMADLPEEIEALQRKVSTDPENTELHRRLAIYYRLAGTPRSRFFSVEEIDKAIELEPLNPRNYVEKGLTMVARRFTGEAERCFKKATEIDPRYFQGWYQLGRMEKIEYQKTMCYPVHLKKAIKYFQKAYKLKPRHAETLYNLGLLHVLRRMFRTAERYALEAEKYCKEEPKIHLLLGTIYLNQGLFEESDREFTEALALMDDEEIVLYEDISVILPPEDGDLYLTYPDEEKIKQNRRYWIGNDPTPSTDLNERRLEHYKRVFLAQELLTDKRLDLKGAETQRGTALISYGLPHKKSYDLGTWIDGPWLIWHYNFPGTPVTLYFQDEFLNGNYHFPIKSDYRDLSEQSIAAMRNIPQHYEFPIDCRMFHVYAETALLRGENGKTRLELSFALPDTVLTKGRDDWKLFVTVFDFDLNRIFNEDFSFRQDTLPRIVRKGRRFGVFNINIGLAPRELDCTLAMEFMQGNWKQRSIVKRNTQIRDLEGKSLKLSSIKFNLMHRKNRCTGILDPMPVYMKGQTLCLSYEIYNLKRIENIARYRLTYAIKNPAPSDEESGIRKTLSYIAASIRGGTREEIPYIMSSIEQSTNESTAADRLQISLETLEKRDYLLVLEVEDLNGGKIIREERTFQIID